MYIFDTNVFTYLLDNSIDIEMVLNKGTLYTTNVQYSELNNTADINKKNTLLNLYELLNMTKLMLESGIWSNKLYWDMSQPWCNNISKDYTNILGDSKSVHDALIGEIAKKYSLTVITNDKKFIKKLMKHGILVLSVEKFLEI